VSNVTVNYDLRARAPLLKRFAKTALARRSRVARDYGTRRIEIRGSRIDGGRSLSRYRESALATARANPNAPLPALDFPLVVRASIVLETRAVLYVSRILRHDIDRCYIVISYASNDRGSASRTMNAGVSKEVTRDTS